MKKPHLIILLGVLFVAVSAFVVWFSLSASSQPQELRGQAYGETCASQQHVNTEFRLHEPGTDKPWTNGNEITSRNYKPGTKIDINCFAKTGSALLAGGVVDIELPNGQKVTGASNTPELRGYTLAASGTYKFTCRSTTISNCSDTDSFNVAVGNGCVKAGCSGQLCVPEGTQNNLSTTCEFKPEYVCYQNAECKIQDNGQCGWTQTDTLKACLSNPPPEGCFYQQVQCVQAPCNPILVCPSATPTSTPTASPGLCGANTSPADLNKDCKVTIEDYALFLSDFRQRVGL